MRRVHALGFVVAALGVLHAQAQDGGTTVLFSPTHGLKIMHAIVDELRDAQDTIDVANYLISEQDIADELVAAKNRGVTVRVITDRGMASMSSSRDEWLAYHGIPVKKLGQGSASGAKFHHKFAVIDKRVTITGSMNWSNDTEAWNYENVLTIRDTTIAKAYAKEFESLFTTGQGNVGSTQDVLFCPTGGYQGLERRIVAEVGLAQTEIVAAIYLFTSWDVAAGLAKALDRGVKVSLLVDGEQYKYSREVVQYLANRGARVKIVRLYGSGFLAEKFHDKYAVIDGKTVITGSYNWAPNQDRYGWDNLIVLRDASLAQKFIQNFASIWSSSVAH